MSKKSVFKKKKTDGFQIRYQSYLRQSIQDNTKNNISKARKQGAEYDHHIEKHFANFSSVNQTMIGSMLYSLLIDARHHTDRYMMNRIATLKNIYSFIKANKGWQDLWDVMNTIEKKMWSKQTIVSSQVFTETMDMLRLHLPYSKMIFGINQNTKEPIIKEMPFYITKEVLNLIENPHSIGRKKTKQLSFIKYQTAEWFHYLAFSFGLYNEDNDDLLAKIGIDYDSMPKYNIPKELIDTDELVECIKTHRKYTMNPNGVVIECQNCGDIEKVIMVEKDGFLLWKVHFNKPGITLDHKNSLVTDLKGSEYCGYLDEKFFPRSLFSVHSDFLDFEFDVYQFILECYAEIVCGTDVLKQFNYESFNMGSTLITEEDQKEVDKNIRAFRYTPRVVYNRAEKSTSSREQLNREIEKYFISGHLRKLPDGYSSSTEAVQHASEFGITVPSGFTFVRPYSAGDEKVRTHYVKTRVETEAEGRKSR